jgi:hypothetical protein
MFIIYNHKNEEYAQSNEGEELKSFCIRLGEADAASGDFGNECNISKITEYTEDKETELSPLLEGMAIAWYQDSYGDELKQLGRAS